MKPGYLSVMLDKVIKRIKEPHLKRDKRLATKWCSEMAEDTEDYLSSIDSQLLKEAVKFNEELHIHGKEVIKSLSFKMGGGGNCVLIYFLTRYKRPEAVLETGVSMGFSSYAFLHAMKLNERGRLFSSDFPYFRHREPERFVGCVVPEDYKSDWQLYINGDKENLKEILPKIGSIDIFHYDSDKSYEGRSFAFEAIFKRLSGQALIIFDDIHDNLHFRDLVKQHKFNYKVLSGYNGGFVGLIIL